MDKIDGIRILVQVSPPEVVGAAFRIFLDPAADDASDAELRKMSGLSEYRWDHMHPAVIALARSMRSSLRAALEELA